ncbi:MAG: TonB-dependent receptor [Acidobacteria bacterium]|nr:TonB-dependent receptor [Acidobacteriota bacterium]
MWSRIVAGALMAAVVPLFPQTSAESAELTGVVTDPSGAPVPGVAVTLLNPATGFTREALTSGSGEYRVAGVSPATYAVRFEKDQFQSQSITDVHLAIGQVGALNVQLKVGQRSEVVEVTGEVALVETERTHEANTLGQEFVRNLPIDRRDYLTFSLLAPGVVDSKGVADNADYRVIQTPNSGLSFYGSNGRGNSVTIDGGESNDNAGGVRNTLSQEAVEEFQINRGGYSAEHGGASGGVINIVSKSGTNAFHGSTFGYFRNQRLDAGDPFARVLESGGALRRVKPDAKRQQLGGSLGGPIKQNRTFFFAAAEFLNRDESNVVSVLTDRSIFRPTAEQEAVLSRLPAAAAAPLRAALTSPASTIQLFERNSGITPFTTNDFKFSLRLDHLASEKNQFLFRSNYADVDETNASTRALVGSTRGYKFDDVSHTALIGWTHLLTPTVINDLRVQHAYTDQTVSTTEPLGPEININGFGFFNKDIFLPSIQLQRRTEFKHTLNLARGAHSIKLGQNINFRNNHGNVQTFFGGRFTFGPLPGALVNPALATVSLNGIQAFNLGLPQSYQQGFGDPIVRNTYPYFGYFAQDSWRVRPGLTLDFGIRYEFDKRKSPLPRDTNNFAPRFGFAWDPWRDGKTSVRGAYGIFYSPIYYQIDYVVNALGLVNGRRQIAQVLTTIQTPGPPAAQNIWQTLRRQGVIGLPVSSRGIETDDLRQFGINVSQTGPIPPLTVLFENSGDYVNPYSQHATLSLERQIGAATAVSASGIYVRSLKITRARDRNLLPAPVNPQLGIRVWRPQDFINPLLFQVNVYESTANAYYAALMLEFKRRLSRSFSLAANYTFSKATDEVTDFNSDFQPNDQTNLRAERALSAFDQRHKIVLYGLWRMPHQISVSPIFRANSARPFNLLAGADINADRHSTTDRPPGAGRNTGIGPAFVSLDLRLSKRLLLGSDARWLEFTAEGFNLSNTLNYSSVNNTVGVMAAPFHITGRHDRGPSDPLGFTSAHEPRRIQLGIRLAF